MKVSINQKALNRIRQGHPWIFRSDILDIEAKQAGSVSVLSPNGKILGQALFSPQSQITLRMMTRGEDKIGTPLFRQRLKTAALWRDKFLPKESCHRLIFGEADGIPSLILDRFDKTLVFQTLSAGLDFFKSTLIDLMREIFDPVCIVERNDVKTRDLEGLEQISQIAWNNGVPDEEVSILGKKYQIDFLSGQKTGFFLDQRFNAQTVARYCSGRLLDAFSHSGQFALQAADRVDSILCVDQSAPALEKIKQNAKNNECHKIETHLDNVFDFLKAEQDKSNQWDSIVLDPPAFVKSRKALAGALRGYKEINLRAMKLLAPGGILATFSCSQNLSRIDFLNVLHSAAQDAKRHSLVLQELTQPLDHPWSLSIPETKYLKGFVLRVD